MVRTRLTILTLLLLATVLFVSGALAWTVERARYHLERSQFANDQLNAYRAVSEATYRHLKQLGDVSISGEAANTADLAASRSRLSDSLAHLHAVTEQEVAFVDHRARPGEVSEIARVAALSNTIERILREHAALRARLDGPDAPQARRALAALNEDEIDGPLAAQIEAALVDETAEVVRANEEAHALLSRLVILSVVVALLGLGVATGTVVFLKRRVGRPMGTLMFGARELANGRLTHRVGIAGGDEFARLGQALDAMADRLQQQHSELLDAQGGLERTVAVRTDELADANARLRRTDEQRQEFLANISHELRTPITIIRGEADVTLRTPRLSVKASREALARILDQSRRLSRLVDDLLLIARADAGAMRLELRSVDLEQLLKEACGHAASLSDGTTKVRLMATEERTRAVGDEGRLMQLFMILLDNAVRYAGAGRQVTASVRTQEDDAMITIVDDGPGMAPEDLENALERFYRGEAGRLNATDGAGLGLHIAKSIVAAHNGEISLASAPGAGLAVVVKLPRALVADGVA